MSGSQLAGRRWWLRGYLAGRPHQRGPFTHSTVGPPQGLPRRTPETHPWHQHSQGAAGSSEAMEETDSTEVKYKIRQWSLPGATIVPVLNVSSRVFWLELDDKALLDSYGCYRRVSFAGRSRRKAYSWCHVARPPRCG